MTLKKIRNNFFVFGNAIRKGFLFCLIIFSALPINGQKADSCTLSGSAEILFTKKSVLLSKKAKKQLDSIVNLSNDHKNCVFVLRTNDVTENIKLNKLMWDRMDAAVNYLFKKRVDSSRFIYRPGIGLDNYNAVYIEFEQWQKPVPALPHPGLKRNE